MSSTCRSCGSPIRWAKTPSGKRMPLDVEPSRQGNVQLGWVGGEEIAIVLGRQADIAGCVVGGIPLYLSHFATCPSAAQHRASRPTVGEAPTPDQEKDASAA